jgi:Ni/Fe-hydrogenase b-type cytochrome subunit
MNAPTATPQDRFTGDAPVQYKRVHIWNWPIRAMHWIAALSIVVLIVTGFYIGGPYFMTSGQASDHFLMGWFRFAHFTAAGVLVATGIVRGYWLFMGNKYERWRALFPWHLTDWVQLWRLTKKYLFVEPDDGPTYLGHNPLQQIAYTAIYGLALAQVLTGFYLYGLSDTGGFFYSAFWWVGSLLGGAQVVRFVHHVLTWFWLMFLPLHVYLSIRADVVHQESRITAIVSGETFVRADIDYVDD